ncbi:MAG: family 10 glycosylhydrolase [Oscillospiraceae bacterium]|nr:family 10 glycosylhydrolase [Oscillospiraceae bacterium]
MRCFFSFLIIILILCVVSCGNLQNFTLNNNNAENMDTEYPSAKAFTLNNFTANVTDSDNPLSENDREIVGVWFSYLDWSNCLTKKNENNFAAAFSKVLSGVEKLGANTMIVHFSAFNDAFYPSDIAPWSGYVSGTLAKDPGFDPAEIIVSMAAARNIDIHAWINPMRTLTDSEYKSIPDKYRIKQWYSDETLRYKYMIKTAGKWILNPTNPEVRRHIADLAAEIVSKYAVAAVHIDDYFYPSGITSEDEKYYDEINPGSNIEKWRRDGTSKMIMQINAAVKAARSDTLFGVSPAGNIDYNYNTMYVDFKYLLSVKNTMDYVAPQIYYGFENNTQPFAECSENWSNLVNSPVRLYIGLACHKIGTKRDKYAGSGKYEWRNVYKSENNMLKRMIENARELPGYGGILFFDYKSLLTPSGNFKSRAKNEINNILDLL